MEAVIDELTGLVEAQIGHYRSLKTVLDREGQAAAEGDPDALADAVRTKETVMGKVVACASQIRRVLAQLAHPMDRAHATLSELAGRLPQPHRARLGDLAGVLKTETARVRRINRSNGDLMADCLNRVRQSLAMLNHLLTPQLVYRPAGAPVPRCSPVHRVSQRA